VPLLLDALSPKPRAGAQPGPPSGMRVARRHHLILCGSLHRSAAAPPLGHSASPNAACAGRRSSDGEEEEDRADEGEPSGQAQDLPNQDHCSLPRGCAQAAIIASACGIIDPCEDELLLSHLEG
jgi:hypothetical protein